MWHGAQRRGESHGATAVVLDRAVSHLIAAMLFAALSIAWSFPLVLNVATHVPGNGPGDNLSFVWNLWWARTAWHDRLDFFSTPYLFHPLGADLSQHTHTALNGALAATILAGVSPVAAQNVLLLASLFLNGFITYLLAYRIASSRFAAIAASIAFAGAPVVLIRLSGHFNLVSAWPIPLSILLFFRALERRSTGASLAAGGSLALIAYCDYYYLVYSTVFIGLCFGARWLTVGVRSSRRSRNGVERFLVALVAIDVILMAIVVSTGGFSFAVGSLQVAMRTTFNLRTTFWVLLGAWALSRWRVDVAVRARETASVATDLRKFLVLLTGFVIGAFPLIVSGVQLWLRGDYTSQRYFWRNAPSGVDLASFLLGNPRHALYGSLTRRAYGTLGLDPVEGVAWIGAVTLLLGLIGWRRLRHEPGAAQWRLAAAVFVVWALGPYLNAFGANLGLILPGMFLRFVPLVSNARIPGRAMVMVCLAFAMLLALTLARMGATWSRGRKALVLVLLLAECAVAPLPLYRVEGNAIYAFLARRADRGAVLELPFGLRDGFGETGHLDHRTLFYQTISNRPMLGGFVARLPVRVKSWYEHAPVVSVLLRLSDPACPASWSPPVTAPREAHEALARWSVRYVVLDRQAASAAMVRYVMATLPLRRLTEDKERVLYELREP